ncbi:MAG TPA: AAA family ATPase, partial [Gemmatimonadaceae bacterium]|nr:AAA family ATPase [Gemmatimonadaceae bacterium]
SLARQRRRAERHAELTARRFDVEITLAARELESHRDELAALELRVAALREGAPAVGERLAAAERTREGAQGARAAAEAQRTELARLVAAQRQSVLQLQGELAVAEERQRNAVARRERAEQERRESEAAGVRVSTDREQAAAERQQLEEELRAVTERLEERAAAEEEVRGVVAQARAALEQNERRLRELRDQVRRLELDRESVQRELVDATRRAETLEGELQQVRDNVAGIAGELARAEEALELARVQVAQSAAALDAARAAARDARDREAATRSELARATESLHQLEGKANALEALERERVGLAPAAAKLLRDRQQFGEGAVLGPLSDFIETTPDTALLVERFLGANLHAVLVRDRAAAEAVRRWHARANPGPLLLLPLDAEPPDPAPDADADADTLLARVNAAPAARSWIRNLLARVRAEEAGAAFVDARGAVWLPGAVSGPGPLRRRAELGALRDAVATADAARRLAADTAEQARGALQAAERTAATAAEEAAAAQREARRAEELRAELERRRQRAERELAEAQALHDRLLHRRGELTERLEALAAQAEGVEEQLAAVEAEGGSLRERLATADQMLEEAREFRTTCQVQQAQAQARLQVARDRERRLDEELTNAEQRMHALHSELSTLADSDQRLATQMEEWRADLEAREGTLRDAEARLAAAETALQEADEALAAAERALDEARREAAQRSEEQHQAELRYTELAGRRRAIQERLETEWRRPLDELIATATMLEVEEGLLRDEADDLKAQLDALGPVNPLAIEEHDEEVKRLDFLTTQRNDLAQAKQSLQHAIREIDTTARELFLATFAQVRENFRQIFMTLFGGGECDLRLENPEQPLDCDIEVHASPRGKRTQRIHLLSSGERALVALSLLFGIFLTKPSPFCLLDEVDAPLDDQNIGRYVRMLNQFKSRTQFIVITHNPRTTTEAADAVYGVTMQEPGVSSLVSVRMRGRQVDEGPGGDGATTDGADAADESETAEAAAAPA